MNLSAPPSLGALYCPIVNETLKWDSIVPQVKKQGFPPV